MAQKIDEIAIQFGVDIDNFRRDLQKANKHSEDAINEQVRNFIRLQRQEVAAKKRADAEKRAADKKATREANQLARERKREREKTTAAIDAQTDALLGSIPVIGTSAVAARGLAADLAAVEVSAFGATVALGTLAGPIAVAAALAAAMFTGRSAAHEYRTELAELNQVTGLLPETLKAFETVGGERLLSALGEAAGEANVKIFEAANGTGEAVAMFKKLGVSATDASGDLKSTDDVVREFIGEVQKLESPMERTAYFTKLFGGAGRQLGAALGNANVDELVGLTQRFGYDAGPRAIKATKNWNIATGGLTLAFKSMGMGATPIVEYLADVVNGLAASLLYTQSASQTLLDTFDFDAAHRAGIRAIQDYAKLLKIQREAAETTQGGGGFIPPVTPPSGGNDGKDEKNEALEHAKQLVAEYIDDTIKFKTDLIGEAVRDDEGNLAYMFHDPPTVDKEKEKAIQHAKEMVAEYIDETIKFRDQVGRYTRNAAGELELLFGDVIDPDEAEKKFDRFVTMVGTANRAASDMVDGVSSLLLHNLDRDSDEARKILLGQFYARKAIAISEILIATAVASVQALTLGPVAGPIFAAAISAGGAVQSAAVAAEQPTFHTGGIVPARGLAPDETPITALSGEGVVSRRGMAALADINRGGGMNGGTPVVVYGARVFDAVTADLAASPASAMSRAIRAKTRRRVGHRG